jgi:rhamnosyltransferase subunit B
MSSIVPSVPPGGSLHVVVLTVGSLGDMHPFIGIARALRRRGHRVTFLTTAVHEDVVRDAGLAFHALGRREDHLALVDDPDVWHPRKGFATLWRGMLGDLLREVPVFVSTLPRDEPCLLLTHPLLLPAAGLARADRPGAVVVGAYLAPASLRTVHDPLTIGPLRIPAWLPVGVRRWIWRRIDAGLIDPVALADLNARRHHHGLAPVAHLIAHLHDVPDLSLTLFPPWFAATAPDWPRPLHAGTFPLYEPQPGRSLPDVLARFLAEGDAPVVFTPGTGHRHAKDYFARALDAILRLGRRAVFLTPFGEQVPASLPAGVLWQSHVPVRGLLARASAIVHHGGVGTTAEALRAGLPQVVVPFAYDQFDNAARVEALGVGRSIGAARASGPVLASALAALLSSCTVARRCATVAARLAQAPDLDALCRAIEHAGIARRAPPA